MERCLEQMHNAEVAAVDEFPQPAVTTLTPPVVPDLQHDPCLTCRAPAALSNRVRPMQLEPP